MKYLSGFAVLTGLLLLGGCATIKPEDYGFQRVARAGQEQYCAPREWVVPQVVEQDSDNDPFFHTYGQFSNLPEQSIVVDGHVPIQEVCITQAQWPQWLAMRTQWNRNRAVTPGIAEALVAQRR